MANLIANYTISINKGVITLTDSSTANYGGETITARKYIITFSDGTTVELNAPIVAGVGDATTYATTKDLALNIELVLTPSVVDITSTYTKSNNILAASFTDSALLEMRRKNILESDPKNILSADNSAITLIERISSYYESAKIFIALADLIGAQEAIDLSFELSKHKDNC